MLKENAIDNKAEIGKRIKEKRMEKGLTQAQLGELVGTKEIGIRQYEIGRNKPREDRLKAIAIALDTDYLYLLIGENQQRRNSSSNHVIERIFDIMEEKNISIKKLSKLTGISLKNLEVILKQSDIDSFILKKIAHGLAINYRWFSTGYDLTDEQLIDQYLLASEKMSLNRSDILAIGKRLKTERERTILHIDEISTLVGIQEDVLSDFENGIEMIDYNTLFNICKLLNISTGAIIDNDYKDLNNHHRGKCIEEIDYLIEKNAKDALNELYEYLKINLNGKCQ